MRAFALALLLASFALPATTSAAPGDLDRGFGRAGVAMLTVPGLETSTSFVAEQPHGRIVVGTSLPSGSEPDSARVFRLYALTSRGRADRTYGRGGRAGDFPDGDAVMLAGGGVVLAQVLPRAGGSSLRLVALAPNGRSNPKFGRRGRVSVPVQEANPNTPVIVRAPDGDLVVALNTMHRGNVETVTLLRFEPGGTLDPGFGQGGQVTISVAPDDLTVPLIGVQRSGRIVVVAGRASEVGRGGIGTLLAGVRPDGALDPAFGGEGDGTHSRVDLNPLAVAIGPDDGIVLAESAFGVNGDLTALVRRLPADGTGAGTATAMPTAVGVVPKALLIDPRGAAVVSAEATGGVTSGVGLARFAPVTFDEGFSRAALLGGILGGGGPRPIALQSDGGILAVADDALAPSVRTAIVVHRVWGGYDTRRPIVRTHARCRRGVGIVIVAVTDESPLAELIVGVRGGRSRSTTHKRLRLRVPAGRHLTIRAVDASGNATTRALTCRLIEPRRS